MSVMINNHCMQSHVCEKVVRRHPHGRTLRAREGGKLFDGRQFISFWPASCNRIGRAAPKGLRGGWVWGLRASAVLAAPRVRSPRRWMATVYCAPGSSPSTVASTRAACAVVGPYAAQGGFSDVDQHPPLSRASKRAAGRGCARSCKVARAQNIASGLSLGGTARTQSGEQLGDTVAGRYAMGT